MTTKPIEVALPGQIVRIPMGQAVPRNAEIETVDEDAAWADREARRAP